MSRYDGDWATREVAKTCSRYLAKNTIKAGERKPRENYCHTAANSTKRKPDSLRGPKCSKSASRKSQNSQAHGFSQPNIPTNSASPLPPDQLVSNLPSTTTMHLPHVVHPHSISESMAIYPQPTAHVVDHWHSHNTFTPIHRAQGLHSHTGHQQPHPYSNPDLEQPLPGPSHVATAGHSFHLGQDVPNPAFMENMYRLKEDDRSPSPSWNINTRNLGP